MITLVLIHDMFTIIQSDIDQTISPEIYNCDFYSITKTKDEVSIIINRQIDIPNSKISEGWRGFKAEGILDFSSVRINCNP